MRNRQTQITHQTGRFNVKRRRLVQALSALPLGSLTTLSGGVTLLGMDSVAAADCSPGARSLVCIFLAGGADSFNMFVPTDQRYAQYRQTRNDMAVSESDLISANNSGQGDFAFHRTLPAFAGMYNSGNLAVIANVGPLIQPTTPEDYALSLALPENLFAHDAQQRLWQTAARKVSGAASGWGGGLLQQLNECNVAAQISGAFSMAGANPWQIHRTAPYTRLNPQQAVERMFGLDPDLAPWVPQSSRDSTAAILKKNLAASLASNQSLMLQEAAASINSANVATQQLETALLNHPLSQWQPDPGNTLESQLHLVTRLVSARSELNMDRQVFFVQLGGWDTHGNQNERLPLLMDALNGAINPYQSALNDLGLADSVTSFTASDFGRTLTSNGDGTDHGWGGHNFVFGDTVSGGRVYGEFPSYASVDNPDDASVDGQFAGRIIPTLSVNQYGATLSRWMGVPEPAIDTVFPDLANFTNRNIGFL